MHTETGNPFFISLITINVTFSTNHFLCYRLFIITLHYDVPALTKILGLSRRTRCRDTSAP